MPNNENEEKEPSRRVDEWLETADRYFSFAASARKTFETGSISTKKYLLSVLGSNLTLADKKLNVSLPKPLELIEMAAAEAKSVNARFEPQKAQANPELLRENYSKNPTLLRGLDSNQ